jgi:hypothetical protein
MTKQYFKELKIVGKSFCIYNISKTAKCVVYSHNGELYFKPPRLEATRGVTINTVGNLVRCTPFTIGSIAGYKEVM